MNNSAFIVDETMLPQDLQEKLKILKTEIAAYYSETIPLIFDTLLEVAEGEMELMNTDSILESSFLQRFMDVHNLYLFADGFTFSMQQEAGMMTKPLKNAFSKRVKERLNELKNEALQFLNIEETECFTLTAYKTFEYGMETGKFFYKTTLKE
jgi:hypothetical protein